MIVQFFDDDHEMSGMVAVKDGIVYWKRFGRGADLEPTDGIGACDVETFRRALAAAG